jgi:hypothetical protein
LYHSTLGLRVIKKKKKRQAYCGVLRGGRFTISKIPLASGTGKTQMVSKTFSLKMAQAKAIIWP